MYTLFYSVFNTNFHEFFDYLLRFRVRRILFCAKALTMYCRSGPLSKSELSNFPPYQSFGLDNFHCIHIHKVMLIKFCYMCILMILKSTGENKCLKNKQCCKSKKFIKLHLKFPQFIFNNLIKWIIDSIFII